MSNPSEPEQEIEVFRTSTQPRAMEATLVLVAMDIPHELLREDAAWSLYVAVEHAPHARAQLDLYWAENSQPRPQPRTADIVDSGWWGIIGYLCVIWSLPVFANLSDSQLLAAGRLHAEAVMDGEIWRVITALTLHADIAHIMSNSLFGVIFGLFVGRHLGSGLGWLLVLICGALANALNALVQPGSFRAIGASTATFAALGLVPAFGWRRGYFRGPDRARGFAPIFGAICILAFTGFGGENIDVLGHVFGFAMGIGMGLFVAHIDLAKISTQDQQRAGGFALFVVAMAWFSALLP